MPSASAVVRIRLDGTLRFESNGIRDSVPVGIVERLVLQPGVDAGEIDLVFDRTNTLPASTAEEVLLDPLVDSGQGIEKDALGNASGFDEVNLLFVVNEGPGSLNFGPSNNFTGPFPSSGAVVIRPGAMYFSVTKESGGWASSFFSSVFLLSDASGTTYRLIMAGKAI